MLFKRHGAGLGRIDLDVAEVQVVDADDRGGGSSGCPTEIGDVGLVAAAVVVDVELGGRRPGDGRGERDRDRAVFVAAGSSVVPEQLSLESENCPGFAPLKGELSIVCAAVSEFVIVTVAVSVLPTATGPSVGSLAVNRPVGVGERAGHDHERPQGDGDEDHANGFHSERAAAIRRTRLTTAMAAGITRAAPPSYRPMLIRPPRCEVWLYCQSSSRASSDQLDDDEGQRGEQQHRDGHCRPRSWPATS